MIKARSFCFLLFSGKEKFQEVHQGRVQQGRQGDNVIKHAFAALLSQMIRNNYSSVAGVGLLKNYFLKLGE
jgi:hypothetical protein